jgi:nitrile hydratase accessory protein
MVRALQDEGLFTPSEWSEALGAEIRRAQAAGDPDTGDTYYHHWLGALEALVAEKNLVSIDGLASCRTAWARAAERTPHGLPIELRPEDRA